MSQIDWILLVLESMGDVGQRAAIFGAARRFLWGTLMPLLLATTPGHVVVPGFYERERRRKDGRGWDGPTRRRHPEEPSPTCSQLVEDMLALLAK